MRRSNHIAFITPRFSEQGTIGGAETLLKNLALQAASAGRQVTVLTTCAENHFTWENTLPAGRRNILGLDVEFFPVDEDRDTGAFLRVQTAISNQGEVSEEEERTWIRNSVNSRALMLHLKEHGDRYDRIVAGPYLFGLVYHAAEVHPGKTLLVPCLHDEPFAYVSVMRDMFEGVAGFMFNTEPERDLARKIFDIPEAKCSVVGMGLDAFDVDADAFARRRGLQAPYIMYAGRREPLKGTPLLVDYFGAFRARTGKDIKLVCSGSGPIDAPGEVGPHILDIGFVSEQEKREAMAGALAFIHPSVNESLGIVLLESWLARTPGLVHANGEVLRWQCRRSGAGLWFKHYPEFEEELMLLLNDANLRKAMGDAGRKYVLDEYTWDKVRGRLLDALDHL